MPTPTIFSRLSSRFADRRSLLLLIAVTAFALPVAAFPILRSIAPSQDWLLQLVALVSSTALVWGWGVFLATVWFSPTPLRLRFVPLLRFPLTGAVAWAASLFLTVWLLSPLAILWGVLQ